jgi:predicted metal-dependent phosphoesterase TrpH
MRLDLHVHGQWSPDSRLRLEAAVDRLGFAGLSGFALTDHNTLAGHAQLRELAARYPMYRFLPCVEVSTLEGHLLVYGVDELPPLHVSLAETVDWVRARGALSVLAHPFRWAHGAGRTAADTARIDGIEAVNGHNGAVANARAELVAARRAVAATGGSDAHDGAGIGRAFTEFPSDVQSLEEVLKAMRTGRTVAGGRSLAFGERLRLSLRTGALRAARGFRPI